jgi:hypothetical protein
MKRYFTIFLFILFHLMSYGQTIIPNYCHFIELVFTDSGCISILEINIKKTNKISIKDNGHYFKKCHSINVNNSVISFDVKNDTLQPNYIWYECSNIVKHQDKYTMLLANSQKSKLLTVVFKQKKKNWQIGYYEWGRI